MDEAESLADHIAIMDHGALVAQGTPAELTSQGEGAGFSFSANSAVDLDALQRIGIPTTASRPLHYRVSQPSSPELISALAADLARQGVLLRSLESHHRNLEEVFLDLTGRHLRS